MSDKRLMTRESLRPAREWFTVACLASRLHSELARIALRMHGDHGPQVSGCVRDHFPEEIKRELRHLAVLTGNASGLAWAQKPPGYHRETMRRLGRAVARAVGSGFYGSQP